MKKVLSIIAVSLAIILIVLAVSKQVSSRNPQKVIEYQPDSWVAHQVDFDIPDGYKLDQRNYYDIVETDSGYDMIFHLIPDS